MVLVRHLFPGHIVSRNRDAPIKLVEAKANRDILEEAGGDMNGSLWQERVPYGTALHLPRGQASGLVGTLREGRALHRF